MAVLSYILKLHHEVGLITVLLEVRKLRPGTVTQLGGEIITVHIWV